MSEEKQVTEGLSLERRNLLKSAGALGLGALATAGGVAGMSEAFAGDMGHHHHAKSGNKAMTDSVHACIQAGHECVAHCIELIKGGDTSIIDCMKSVQETVAFCSGHAYISASGSKYLDDMCRLGIKICGNCQKECEKHAKKHPQCKACGEACATCVKECKKHLKV